MIAVEDIPSTAVQKSMQWDRRYTYTPPSCGRKSTMTYAWQTMLTPHTYNTTPVEGSAYQLIVESQEKVDVSRSHTIILSLEASASLRCC